MISGFKFLELNGVWKMMKMVRVGSLAALLLIFFGAYLIISNFENMIVLGDDYMSQIPAEKERLVERNNLTTDCEEYFGGTIIFCDNNFFGSNYTISDFF